MMALEDTYKLEKTIVSHYPLVNFVCTWPWFRLFLALLSKIEKLLKIFFMLDM